MSALQMMNEALVVLAAAPPPDKGGDGILDMVGGINTDVDTLAKAVGGTVATVFLVYQAVVSKMTWARVLSAGVVAAVLVWFVKNNATVEDGVDQEVNNRGAGAYSWSVRPPGQS